MARVWDDFLTDRDQQVREHYGSRLAGFGQRPVVMVIDVNYNFTGYEREPILESIKKYRNSCGQEGWDAAESTGRLLAAAREKRLPIIYTTEVDQRIDGWDSGRANDKNARRREDRAHDRQAADEGSSDAFPGLVRRTGKDMHEAIKPEPVDILVGKRKPSAFFGTVLVSYLVELQADSIIVTGSTTSGCVRATVVDGFSYHFNMQVVEECTFDRFQASHALNLYDLHMKYADVVTLNETMRYIDGLDAGLFDEQMPSLVSAAQTRAQTA